MDDRQFYNKKIYTYFHKYLKPEYDYHGIILEPTFDPKESTITWLISNPKNISYSVAALMGFPDELLREYSNLIGDQNFFRENYKKLCKFEEDDREYYLNSKDNKELQKRLKTINKIEFKNYYLEFDSEWFEINISGSEEVTITIAMRFTKSIDKNKDIALISDILKKLFGDDDFYSDYQYVLFNPIIGYLWNMPTFTDTNYFYFAPDILPLYSDGKKIKINWD